MIIVAILAVGTVSAAAWAGLRILTREYLPLLKELERTMQTMEKTDEQDLSEEGRTE